MDQQLSKEIIAIVGEANFSTELIDLVSYSSDASRHWHRPQAVVWPTATAEVSAILALANSLQLPVIPRGSGTGLAGMAVPSRGGLVMDMIRMNRIIRLGIEDRLVVVQPGVVYQDLQQALAPHNFFFPPDPASGKVATLGGNVATNAGGLHGAKYGVTKDFVLGLEVVLASGEVMRTGSNCMKCASGYDLTRLLVGSEGTLGVITEITLKIDPMPQATATAMAAFATLEDAGRAISAIMLSGVVPSVCEFLDSNTIKLLQRQTDLALPQAEAVVLLECDALHQAEADYQMSVVVGILDQHHATMVQRAQNQAEALEMWKGRKSISGMKNQIAPKAVSEDVTVPLSKVADLVRGIDIIAKRWHLTLILFGHAGDGNFHPNILFEGEDQEEVRRVHGAVEEIFKLALSLGGTLTGEHGIGLEKAPFMTWEHDEVAMKVMQGIKSLLDPNNILNPGKMGLA